ncbi:hypothetical protein KsCSTR_30740 [Candidatus Kuenenia stuttgartiensis]|uniref:Uncharacterized protein n=1 Tax=Kuenenia stuttgartiensis TaxID=174633 RepID=Q1Q5E8_KUEST|nr:hypothetical protein KsCSTR_30740 [Candidatus Kuenenia stuttgartiensis]CAJ75234.1 unknown protein [Candidatus Kuenenia stuttgartiensis]
MTILYHRFFHPFLSLYNTPQRLEILSLNKTPHTSLCTASCCLFLTHLQTYTYTTR